MAHKSVLLQESISGLKPKEGDIIVDATLGNGGHTELICQKTKGNSTIIAFDLDEDAIERSRERLSNCSSRIIYINESFRFIEKILDEQKIEFINSAIFDLGFSSDQIEESGRGFSFLRDEPLIMTFSKKQKPGLPTAYDVVNSWEYGNLKDIIFGFGEERYASSIASEIVFAREKSPIETTSQLVQIIKKATPERYHRGKIHPATRTFQAIRIAVNNELGSLEEGLDGSFNKLCKGGRISVISFHSLEDRIVKRLFKQKFKEGVAIIHTKKPQKPSQEEILNNPRARSAKLRILEKK